MWNIAIWVINAWNMFYMMVYPLWCIFRVGRLLRKHADEIRFLYDEGGYDWMYTSDDNYTPQKIKYIVAQLWLDEESFLEWKMTEQGEILTHRPGVKRRLFERERMIYYGPREDNKNFLRYRYITSYSTRGIMGWMIRRYVSQAFVMAKMSGFKPYRLSDYIRR